MAQAYRNVGHRNRQTLQTESASPNQKQNNAGGYSFTLDSFGRLERFLILGADAPTYYASARDLILNNAAAVQAAINEDGIRAVDMIVDVSTNGRAYRNDAALFALAMASAAESESTRTYAMNSLSKVARIGTHLFEYAEFVQQFRGWGRALARAVAEWYTEKNVDSIAYQCVKYRQRNGWSHRDMLRLSHPETSESERRIVFDWICGRPVNSEKLPPVIRAYEQAKTATPAETVSLIKDFGLPREAIPTDHLNDPKVWEALLENMPMTALIRNLGKMSTDNINLFKPLSSIEQEAVRRITDQDVLQKARIHPFGILLALKTYQQGNGFRGKMSWTPNQNIVSALEQAFQLSFKTIVPTGKRHLLAVDISASMGWESIMNTNVYPSEAAAAMALITMKTEPASMITAFSGRGSCSPVKDISRMTSINSVIQKFNSMPAGGTDCAAPMLYAMDNNIETDVFIVYTDNETWAGYVHPHEALRDYRRKTGIDAKLIVVGMTSTGFTIADPNDPGMLDVVGFDANAPNVMAEFVR